MIFGEGGLVIRIWRSRESRLLGPDFISVAFPHFSDVFTLSGDVTKIESLKRPGGRCAHLTNTASSLLSVFWVVL